MIKFDEKEIASKLKDYKLDLSPADMILFKQHQFGGFVTDLGGVTSHTAILARTLGLPAMVGGGAVGGDLPVDGGADGHGRVPGARDAVRERDRNAGREPQQPLS